MVTPKRTLSDVTRNCKYVASLVISCGYKGGWWLEETYCLTRAVCERARGNEGHGRGSERESSEGFEVHDDLGEKSAKVLRMLSPT